MKFRWGLLVLLLAFAGCGRDGRHQNSAQSSGSFRWSHFPVELRADSGLRDGGPVEEDLLAAVAFWEVRAGKTLFKLETWPAGQAPYTGELTNPDTLLDNVVFLQKPWPNTGDWTPEIAGKTVVHSTSGDITHAVVFLNGESRLCSGLCDQQGEGVQTSRRRLIAHELGHFLGFAHVNDKSNIMFPEIQPGGALDTETLDVDVLHNLTD